MSSMAYVAGEVTKDLSDALHLVLGAVVESPEPVLVLAWYLDSLAKEYGLSESLELDLSPLDRLDLPAPAQTMVNHYLADEDEAVEVDSLRDQLYSVFLALSQDRDARRTLNKRQPMSEMAVMHLAQIYWNLEGNQARPMLPIRTGQRINVAGRQVVADIKVPGVTKDFATMRWAARVNQKAQVKSAGQGFRTQGARLAVLAARLIVSNGPPFLGDLDEMKLRFSSAVDGKPRLEAIHWHGPESDVELQPTWARRPRQASSLVLVGRPIHPSAGYQRRRFDDQIDKLWLEGGDRRLWLVGGPGLGKSYSAGRVALGALGSRGDDGESLLVWVDSAGAGSVTRAYAEAADRLSDYGLPIHAGSGDSEAARARALLDVLAASRWRWLVVLDNADSAELFQAGLIPPGNNSNGRVLITTTNYDHRMGSNGRLVFAGLFTAEEAEGYLRSGVHARGRASSLLQRATSADTKALAEAVGHQPLALSIAAGTIIANAMSVADWITHFRQASAMDIAADEPDAGGYPHLIGAAWRTALDKAARGLPDGVVERAAMVAALQDPDGHPTWLWDREAVVSWVAGEPADHRPGGMPAAIRRLVDHGLLELRGATWKHGRVAIHRLAARAVRDNAPPVALAELAAILADEWLLQLTEDESLAPRAVLQANIRSIAGLPALPKQTRQILTALLRYGGEATRFVEGSRALVDLMGPYLARGGAFGRLHLADEIVDLGNEELLLDRADESKKRYCQAVRLLHEVAKDRTVSEDLQVRALLRLGRLEESLGHPDLSRTSLARALTLLERLVDLTQGGPKLGSYLVDLASLYDQFGSPGKAQAARVRGAEILQHPPALVSGSNKLRQFLQARDWLALGNQLRHLGRADGAQAYLVRAATAFGELDRPSQELLALSELGRAQIETAEWALAEQTLSRFLAAQWWIPPMKRFDERTLLASVQQRLGRPKDAAATLAAVVGDDPRSGMGQAGTSGSRQHLSFATDKDAVQGELQAILLSGTQDLLGRIALETSSQGEWADAVGLSESALDIAQQRADASPGNPELQERLADAHLLTGSQFVGLGQLDRATRHLIQAVGIYDVLLEFAPTNEQASSLALALWTLGIVQSALGESDASAASFNRAVRIWGHLHDHSPELDVRQGFSAALRSLAGVHLSHGRGEDAIDCANRLIRIWQADAEHVPVDFDAQRELAFANEMLGLIYLQLGRNDEAEAPLWRSVAGWELVGGLVPGSRDEEAELGVSRFLLGVAYGKLDNLSEAIDALSQSVSEGLSMVERDPMDTATQESVAWRMAALSNVYEQADCLDEAADSLDRAVKRLQMLVALEPGKHERKLLEGLRSLVDLQRRRGRGAEAEAASAKADELSRRFPSLGE